MSATMEVNYKVSLNDYLQYYLYNASHSARLIDQQKRTHFWLAMIVGVIAVFFLLAQNTFMAVVCAILAVVIFIFYPGYQRKKLLQHYQQSVRESYEGIENEVVNIRFSPDCIEISDSATETRIKYNRVKAIIETGEHFFLQFITGNSLILRKNACPDMAGMQQYLQDLAKTLNIAYHDETNWKWK